MHIVFFLNIFFFILVFQSGVRMGLPNKQAIKQSVKVCLGVNVLIGLFYVATHWRTLWSSLN